MNMTHEEQNSGTVRRSWHPMFVHMPLAMWILAPATDLAYLFSGQSFWWRSGFWLICASLVSAIPAAITGFAEAVRVHNTHPAMRTLNRHMLLMMAAFTLHGIALVFRYADEPDTSSLILVCSLSFSGALLTIIGGHLGGTLVFNFGMGRYKDAT